MKVNAVVPLSPSALLTSSMVSVGKSIVIDDDVIAMVVGWMVAQGDGLDRLTLNS